MDRAVLAAYGWEDVELDHDFRGEGKEARYSLSEGVKEELLRRLLELNFEIAEQESKMQEAGGKKGKKKKQAAKGKAKKSDQQMGLL